MKTKYLLYFQIFSINFDMRDCTGTGILELRTSVQPEALNILYLSLQVVPSFSSMTLLRRPFVA